MQDFELMRMPTREELTSYAERWWADIGSTFYDQWPEDLRALSAPTKMIALAPGIGEELVEWTWGGSNKGRPRPQIMSEIANEMDMCMDWREHFIKLNSRSPKDLCHPGLPVTCSGRQALNWLTVSMRCYEDLMEFSRLPKERGAYVLMRENRAFQKESELRCFIVEEKIVGSSVYHYNDNEVMAFWRDAGAISYYESVERYIESVVIPRCHIDTLVVDIAVSMFNGKEPEVVEINPFGLSDPCLFGTYAELARWGGGLKISPLRMDGVGAAGDPPRSPDHV